MQVGSGTPEVLALSAGGANGPAITSATSASATVGRVFDFTVTATGTPTPAITSTAAPAWLTLTDNHNGTADLSGTPPANSAGTYSMVLKASNSAGVASQAFTLTVGTAPNRTATYIDFSSSGNPGLVGDQIQYDAVVNPDPAYPGNATPSGVATFSDNGTVIAGCGSVRLSGLGEALCNVTYSSAGTGSHTISVAYGGDPTFAPSSAQLTETVQ